MYAAYWSFWNNKKRILKPLDTNSTYHETKEEHNSKIVKKMTDIYLFQILKVIYKMIHFHLDLIKLEMISFAILN